MKISFWDSIASCVMHTGASAMPKGKQVKYMHEQMTEFGRLVNSLQLADKLDGHNDR